MPRSWSEALKACRAHPRRTGGRWCSCRVGWRYRLGLPDPVTGVVGRPKWSRTFPTKDAADADQRAVRTAIANGTFTADRGITVEVFLQDWLNRKEAAGRKTSTVVGYRRIVQNHLVPRIGRHRLGALRPAHVQAMLDAIAAAPSLRSGKGEEPVTAGTLRNIRACLRAALSDAERQGLVPRNVAKLVELPTVKRRPAVTVAADRLALFLGYVETDPLEALWLMDMVYGMRRAELMGIGWTSIDDAAKVIRVEQTLLEIEGDHACPHCRRTHKRLLFDTPKSAAGERVYPLVPEIEAALFEQRRRQDHDREVYGSDYVDHGLVFAEADGNPMRPSRVSDAFKRIMRASGAADGLDRVPSLKALRSSMVTALHEEGVALEVISTVTGHADTRVTRDHYLAVSAERARVEFGAIATRLSGNRSDRLSDQQRKTVAHPLPDGKGVSG
jgi:integrase